MRCDRTICLWCAAFLAVAMMGRAWSQDEIYSGPQPGEELKPFDVIQVNSPDDVEEIQIGASAEPTLICFMHKITEPALGLFINVEFYVSGLEGIQQHYVVLTDDQAKTEQQLKRWAERSFLRKAPMSLSPDGPEGPGDYGLNRNVTVTVLIAKDNKVVHNFAWPDPSSSDAPQILHAIASMLGQPEPDFDALRQEMRRQRDMRRMMQRRAHPVFKLAPQEELGKIMWRMIFTEADRQANAKQRAQELVEWAGDHSEKQTALRQYCQAILDADIEINQYSRQALQELAKDD